MNTTHSRMLKDIVADTLGPPYGLRIGKEDRNLMLSSLRQYDMLKNESTLLHENFI